MVKSGSPPVVGYWQALVLGICTMEVGPGIAIAAGYQLQVSGRFAWLVVACAVFIATLVASAIALLARQVVTTGSVLSYVRLTLPKWAINLTAATLLSGYIIGPASNVLGSAMYLGSVLIEAGFTTAGTPQNVCLIVFMLSALGTLCAYWGIELSAKIVFVLGIACIPVVLLITIAAAASYGFDVHRELNVSHASWMDLSRGVFAALGFFIGFDGVTSIASETAEPKRNVPRILYWTLTVPGIVTAVAALFQTPVLISKVDSLNAGASPTAILASAGGMPRLGVMADWLLCLATIAGQIGWLNFSSTIIATAARDGFLPRWLSSLSKKRGTPFRAAVLLSLISVLISVVLAALVKVSALVAVLYSSNMIVLLWLIPYILVCWAAIAFERKRGRRFSATILASALGAVAIGLLLILQMSVPMDRVSKTTNWLTVALVAFAFCAIAVSKKETPTLDLTNETLTQ